MTALTESVPSTTADPVTPYFTFRRVPAGSDETVLKQIYALRYEVYCLECGFLPAEKYQSGLESDEFDPHVEHFIALNMHAEIVGTLRLVQPVRAQSFPYEQHCTARFDNIPLPPRQECGEISRLVVRQQYRRRVGDSTYGVAREYLEPGENHDRRQLERTEAPGGHREHEVGRRVNSPQILMGLYRAVYRYSLEVGVRYWYAAMEKSLARTLARFAFVFSPIGAEADYYGPVTPYIADLRELERLVGKADPRLLAWLRSDEASTAL
jgi:N-acyl amino acid synthase of PEP-CTERM/exosortase system